MPTPRRRTFAAPILGSALSMLPALRHPCLRWSATPAPRAWPSPRGIIDRKRQNRLPRTQRFPTSSVALAWVLVAASWGVAAAACPFCGVVGRSLAQRRDAAAVTAVGESAGPVARDDAGRLVQPFTVRQPLRGRTTAGDIVAARVAGPIAGTAILFETAGVWEAVAADEALIAHVAAAPAVTEPVARRLAWYAPRLEHPDPAIASDAYAAFGLAAFADVRAAAGSFDPDKLRHWLDDPGIDQRRRGFYGLALGIVAAGERDAAARARHVAALRGAIDRPASDLRAGFDGLLAGLVVAEGAAGLDALESRGLLDAATRAGDARHALAVLRFAAESLADTLPRSRVTAATARLLANPAVAADAAVDLARYGDWSAVERVAGLWDALGGDDPLVRRAVAGYLAACPLPAAREHLDRLRAADPDRLRAALEAVTGPR